MILFLTNNFSLFFFLFFVFLFVLKLPCGRFLQPARMNPFGRAEKKNAEEVRRDHECLKNN